MTFTVRNGELTSVPFRVPAELADRWELLDRQEVDAFELSREADGPRRYRLAFNKPVVDKKSVRFRYRIPLDRGLDAAAARELSINRIAFEDGESGATRVSLELDPQVVLEGAAPGWIRAPEGPGAEPAGERFMLEFVAADPPREGRPFSFKARALRQLALPALVIPRLLVRTTEGVDGSRRTIARYWAELHGPELAFALPGGLEWVEARVDGRIADQVDYDESKAQYRLRFPGDAVSRPLLVELEYQETVPKPGSSWRLPELKGGAVVLQVLWEARLPWSLALVGTPRGWSDENHWSWSGFSWKRRPGKDAAGLAAWLVGSGGARAAIDDVLGSASEDSDRYLFSRRGEPTALVVWLVRSSWLVFLCSGLSLVVGFFAIFLKLRFRTIWLGIAIVAVLAGTLAEPAVTLLAAQAAALGAFLALTGAVDPAPDRPRGPADVAVGARSRSGCAARPGFGAQGQAERWVGRFHGHPGARAIDDRPSTCRRGVRAGAVAGSAQLHRRAGVIIMSAINKCIDLKHTTPSTAVPCRGRLRRARAVWLGLCLASAVSAAAAGEPEIIGVRAPAGKISRYIPPGTELRVLPAELFESLVTRATEGLRRQLAAEPPRLLRARHVARWDGRILAGRTELVIEKSAAVSMDFALEPWSPAVLGVTAHGGAHMGLSELPIHLFAEPAPVADHTSFIARDLNLETFFGARDSGKQTIWLGRHARQELQIDWALEARERRIGRGIHLALPAEATTTLALRFPETGYQRCEWDAGGDLWRRSPSIMSSGKSRPSRVGSSSSFSMPKPGIRRRARISGYRGRAGSTCARRSIESSGRSTGRPTGCSSWIRAIPSRWRSSSIPAWS